MLLSNYSTIVLRATGSIDISPEFTTSDGNSFTARLEPDSIGMYQYDAIGNLIRDQYEGVHISWTPYGKVQQVRSRHDSLKVSYTYDAAGNRIEKKVETLGEELETIITRYLRDASGNVLAIYQDSLLSEQPIYGSSRIGMYTGGKLAAHRNMGTKRYELSNHLGNVLTVITDSIGMVQDSVWATVASTTDYYPFGLGMQGRSFSDSTYRYGFNGKERDQNGEWGGDTQYDYGFRIYNPKIGKFLSVDPLFQSYPWLSTYQFAQNDPIRNIDIDGLEGGSTVETPILNAPTSEGMLSTAGKRLEDWWNSWSFPSFGNSNNSLPLEIPNSTAPPINENPNSPIFGISNASEIKFSISGSIMTNVSVSNNVTFFGYRDDDAKGCFRRCQNMINSAGFVTVDVENSAVIQMTKYNSSGELVTQPGINDGIKLINDHLDDGKPITVGTDYVEGHTGNFDQTTDHWIVIVGRGVDDAGTFYNYYDPQTGIESVGTSSENNKLYLQNNNTLTGDYRVGTQYERTYTVTMVRPNEDDQ